MADNILKRIWNFIIRKKKLSSEDKLIISELKALYHDKTQNTLKKQQQLLNALEGSNTTDASEVRQEHLSEDDSSVASEETSVSDIQDQEDDTGSAILSQMFECEQIWDDFDAVYDYINRILEGADFIEKTPEQRLRDMALQEERLNKIELDFENLRKDKFVEPQEKEAVFDRLKQIRKLIDEKKAHLAALPKKTKEESSLVKRETKEDVLDKDVDKKAEAEAAETSDAFSDEMASLIDSIQKKHGLKLTPEEVRALLHKIKNMHLRKLFEEKIKVLEKRSHDFKRDFDKAGFDKPYIPNPKQELRYFDINSADNMTRDELLKKLGIFLTDVRAQEDLTKMITPQIKLIKTKGTEIIERRKKQYQKSVDVFISKNKKDNEKTEIPKELAVPIAEVLKKHMALSIDRENGFVNQHNNSLLGDAHDVVINGKKQIVAAQRKKVEQEQALLKLKSKQRKKEQEQQQQQINAQKEKEQKTFQHNLKQQQAEAAKKNKFQHKKEEHEQYLRHMEFMANLQEKKKRYYKMRQDFRITARETQKKLLESKIDNTEKQIVELQNTLNEYEKNKIVNRKRTEETLKKEDKVMRSHISEQRQKRKEMHAQYLKKMADEEAHRKERMDEMHKKMYVQTQQTETQNLSVKERIAKMREQEKQVGSKPLTAKERIDNIRNQERKVMSPQEHKDFGSDNLVGRRFAHQEANLDTKVTEYHRDFTQKRGLEGSQEVADMPNDKKFGKVQKEEVPLNGVDAIKELGKAKQVTEDAFTGSETKDVLEKKAEEKFSLPKNNIEPHMVETQAELDKALKEKADKIRQDAVAENEKKRKEEESAQKVSLKIKETKKVFKETVQKKEEHKEEVLKELTTKQETVRKEIEKKQKAEEERMQEIKRLRETAIDAKKHKQEETKAKQQEENRKRQEKMMAEQKKKREEVKRKMEEEKKRQEELRRKMENDKKKRALELKKKRDAEIKKREDAKRELEAKKKKAKIAAAKKKQEAEAAAAKLRREKMLKEQELKRKKAREAMEKKEKNI